jgi:biotin synthase-related radical SAM superfamily protein
MDRSAIAKALAKAQAYKQCGKQAEAERWARELVRLLECADILR